jgi:2-C-methyl-D-erythritol 4-phosphate cytidylyltransferase
METSTGSLFFMKSAKSNVGVVIPSAGSGKRMSSNVPKQFLLLGKKPILVHTLETFEQSKEISDVIVVASKETLRASERLVQEYSLSKVKEIILGGKERQHSVANGCAALRKYTPEIILVHDAVRPFISEKLLRTLIANAQEFGAVVPAVIPKDTIGLISSRTIIEKFPLRTLLRNIQTPQAFRSEILFDAIAKAEAEHFLGADESSIVHYAGFPVTCIEGSPFNIKITTEEDLSVGEVFLKLLLRGNVKR